MTFSANQTATLFSNALQSISQSWLKKQTYTKRLLNFCDPIEQMVTASLLRESVSQHLELANLKNNALIIFIDRFGGGDGLKTAASIIDILGSKKLKVSFVYVSFCTPSRGIGTLIRTNLIRKGAIYGIQVEVVAHNRPAEGLKLSSKNIAKLFEHGDLCITYAPNGVAGLINSETDKNIQTESLLANSHLNILSFPNPENTYADLKHYSQIINDDPVIKKIRFWVQIEENEILKDLGQCSLGKNGDANERLWILLDNAKRLPYKVVIEPMDNDIPIGVPLICPCKTILETSTFSSMSVNKIISAGNRFIVVGQGKQVFS